ncbi:MAG: putative selenium-dependent hydroxylase accessory protein YqeC [Chloroflexi bacterium]|nr:MAG: putative selenium-dependent hydroxylase accessory protein YqeC [Chloroflexota bacterium]
MKLYEAFNILRGDVVAFIGAGGKTSTMVSLGYELAEQGWRVLATTTTRIGEDQLSLMPAALPYQTSPDTISQSLTENRFIFIYRDIQNGKVYGPDKIWVQELMDSIDSDVLLVEADGARGLPLKAPYPHEPVIPPETSLVIPIASLSILGKPLDETHVYNPDAIIERYGFQKGNRIKSPWIAQIIRDETLGLYGVPSSARVIAFLNQAPSKGYARARARLISKLALKSNRFHGVAIGSVRAANPIYEVQRPIGAVVLAAGLSTRMGQSKILLPWDNNKTIIEHIIEQLIVSRVDYIVVVTGHMAQEVKDIVKPLGVKVVFNRSYKTGEMLSSLKAGLKALPDHIAAAMVVLGDQPRIQPKVIYQVLSAYAEGTHDLIAPSYKMKRGHPILIGRRYWNEILKLPRHGAPRDVINAHNDQILYINVDTDSVLKDVDTPEDYVRERWQAGID